ncbi:HIT family protein [Williamsia muralis]|uniref:HIT family protein n=1 Tax=Williamsia marianensis TaxID=85044 RepID=A0ABU4F0P4_WILMA|nr:HIT family protein [Williamsia muralis]MDV7137075.1 HIT family protein [Williamsia muralis]
MTDVECAFCKIVERDDSIVREVYRDEHVVAFFPTEPAVLGHLLVVPKRHVQDIWGLAAEEGAQLSDAVLRLSDALRSALLPEGLNIIQSNGEAATQTVPHLHVHLVPRRSRDAMGPIWPQETNYSEARKDDTQRRVVTAVNSLPQFAQPELSPEDRRKHLDYIQAVVTRQSAASSSAKGWLLPVTTAAFGFALTQHLWPLAALGIVAVILFAYLDANYLRSEKAFRKLYNTVAGAERMVPLFTLDPSDADEPPAADAPEDSGWKKIKRMYIPEWAVWKSWSIAPFYTALLTLGTGVLIAAAMSTPQQASRSTIDTPPNQQGTPAVVSTTEPVADHETTVSTQKREPTPETAVTSAPATITPTPEASGAPPP